MPQTQWIEIVLSHPNFFDFICLWPKVHSCIASLSNATNYLKVMIHLPILILYSECSTMSIIFNVEEFVGPPPLFWYLPKLCSLSSNIKEIVSPHSTLQTPHQKFQPNLSSRIWWICVILVYSWMDSNLCKWNVKGRILVAKFWMTPLHVGWNNLPIYSQRM